MPAPDFGMLEFDLGSLSLDLGDEVESDSGSEPAKVQDPLATKLELSEEFIAIGDMDGARTLIEEVIAEASGDMQLKAKRALSDLPSL
jgi:pilus assembly protein FimV